MAPSRRLTAAAVRQAETSSGATSSRFVSCDSHSCTPPGASCTHATPASPSDARNIRARSGETSRTTRCCREASRSISARVTPVRCGGSPNAVGSSTQSIKSAFRHGAGAAGRSNRWRAASHALSQLSAAAVESPAIRRSVGAVWRSCSPTPAGTCVDVTRGVAMSFRKTRSAFRIVVFPTPAGPTNRIGIRVAGVAGWAQSINTGISTAENAVYVRVTTTGHGVRTGTPLARPRAINATGTGASHDGARPLPCGPKASQNPPPPR